MVAPSPADHTAAVQIDPLCSAHLSVRHRQVPPTRTRAEIGDVTSPAAVGSKGRKVLLQMILRNSGALTAAVAARSEPSPGPGFEHSPAHETRHPMPAHLEASGPELLMHPWCTVEATVPLKHRLDLSRDGRVFLSSWTRVVLPLPPVVEAAAGYPQLPEEPGCGEAIGEGINQLKPLGGSFSLHLRGEAEWAGGRSVLPPA